MYRLPSPCVPSVSRAGIDRSLRSTPHTLKTRYVAERLSLACEPLEDRRTLSAWTVQVLDTQNLIPIPVEDQMRAAANFVMSDLNRHISWKGTLDLQLNVQTPHPDYDGFTPSILQVMGGGRNATIYEMQTGIDPMPNNPDLGMTVFLGRDGTVKLYGMKAYFDPEPGPYRPANVPSGYFDFIGVLTHEITHSIAFQAGTTDFNRYITVDQSGNRFFNGPETVRLLGRPLPLTTMGSTHYGNGRLADNPIRSGLMYEWGNYGGNRLNWGKLDFAVLKDVGITVINTQGLPFLDTYDSQMPRLIVGTSLISENMPAGTVVTNVTTTLGSDYTFQIVAGGDGYLFRMDGTSLVANATFNYEVKNTYQIFVRMIDRNDVWTDIKLNVRVMDVPEDPVLIVPASAVVDGGTANLGGVRIGGDNRTVTAVFYSATAVVGYSGNDSALRVVSVRNATGGTTLTLTGTVEALNRNFRYVYYRGNEDRVSLQIAADGRNWGGGTIRLVKPEPVGPVVPVVLRPIQLPATIRTAQVAKPTVRTTTVTTGRNVVMTTCGRVVSVTPIRRSIIQTTCGRPFFVSNGILVRGS